MPKLNLRSSQPLSVILTFEGLSVAALGSYGCSWNETPALDQIASEGVVWDRWTSPSDLPSGLIHRWLLDSSAQITSCQQHGGALLVTDDSRLDLADHAFGFGTILRCNDRIRDRIVSAKPVDSFDQSCLAGLFSAAMDAIKPSTRMLWIHSAALRDCWDAPVPLEPDSTESTEPFEDDGTGYHESPALPVVLPLQVDPPRLQLDADHDPDWLFAWMSRYATQVRMLDEILEWMLDSLTDRNPSLLIAGASGYSLGENGWLGHHVGPLRSSDIRLPFITSGAGPLRVPNLISANQFSRYLDRLVACDPTVSPDEWCQDSSQFEPVVETVSDRATSAITTPEWFCIEDLHTPGIHKLFVKPDDVNDVNDISRLRRDEVDRLTTCFQKGG